MSETKKFYVGGNAYDVSISGQTFDHGMPDAWVANATTQYNALVAAMKEVSLSGIPFFITTDHHGDGTYGQQWLANTDPNIRNINLGDYSPDIFGPVSMASLAEQTSGLPNYIGVPGNHDFKKNADNPANYFDINNSFKVVGGRRHNQYGYGTVKDDALNVKYIIIQPETINLDTTSGFTTALHTEQVKWLINELSVNDGYDIVILQHKPLYGGNEGYTDRDGATYAPEDFNSCDITQMLKDRISGASGTFTDSDSVAHNYDFVNLQGRFLCTLHGHMHTEMWRTVDGLTSFCAVGYLTNYASTFGLIDRANNKLRIWRFDSTAVYNELVLDIGITETAE